MSKYVTMSQAIEATRKQNWLAMDETAVETAARDLPETILSIGNIMPSGKETNARHEGQVKQRVELIANSLREKGQTGAALLLMLPPNTGSKIDAKIVLDLLRGNIRRESAEYAKKHGMTFMAGEFAGKPIWENLRCKIVGTLSPQTRLRIVADHSDATALDVAGLAKTVFQLAQQGMSERDTLFHTRGTLDMLYPLSEEKLKDVKPWEVDNGASYVAARHGRAPFKFWLDWSDGPRVLIDAYLDSIAYKRAGPTVEEMKALIGTYRDERDDPKNAMKYSPNNPGPKFRAHFASAEKNWKKAKTRAVRGPGMLTQEEQRARIKTTEFRASRIMLQMNLYREVPKRVFDLLDTAAQELYKAAPKKAQEAYDTACTEAYNQLPTTVKEKEGEALPPSEDESDGVAGKIGPDTGKVKRTSGKRKAASA